MGQKSSRSRRRSDSDSSGGSRKGPRKDRLKAFDKRKRYYHWNDDLDFAMITIDLGYINKVVKREMRRRGSTNMRKFLKERNLETLYVCIEKNRGMMVKTLKRFCRAFKVNAISLEKKGVILRPNIYPVDMRSNLFVKMKTHVLNEGRIKSVSTLSYSNQDPVLLKYFMDRVREVGGGAEGPYLGTNALVATGDPILARALVASGLQPGKKTLSNPPLDTLLRRDKELFKYHIKATLTEEGWFSLTIDSTRRVKFPIAFGRSIDVTEKLTRGQIDELRSIVKEIGKKKIPIRSIQDPDLLMIISRNPPILIDQEVNLLKLSHREKQWSEGYPTSVRLSKTDRITAFWENHFTSPELIDLIHNEYGLLLNTWKARRYERLYEVYKRYRGKKLTDGEIQEIRNIRKENPPKVTVEWISEKVKELFPNVEWGGDLERIRRMLGRKKSE